MVFRFKVEVYNIFIIGLLYTLCHVQCTMYSVQCTLYNVHCTMYTVQCTMYSVHAIDSSNYHKTTISFESNEYYNK